MNKNKTAWAAFKFTVIVSNVYLFCVSFAGLGVGLEELVLVLVLVSALWS